MQVRAEIQKVSRGDGGWERTRVMRELARVCGRFRAAGSLVFLVPKLLFGNALPRNSCFAKPWGLRGVRETGVSRARVPKQEFGNEGIKAKRIVFTLLSDPCSSVFPSV